jgi:hypothetical protein
MRDLMLWSGVRKLHVTDCITHRANRETHQSPFFVSNVFIPDSNSDNPPTDYSCTEHVAFLWERYI